MSNERILFGNKNKEHIIVEVFADDWLGDVYFLTVHYSEYDHAVISLDAPEMQILIDGLTEYLAATNART